MPNEPLIPALQRQFRNGVGAAGDTTGNFIHANAKAVQDAARVAALRADGLGRRASGSGKTAGAAANTYAQGLGRAVQSYAEAAGRAVDGGGRAAGGRVGDWGNGVKDVSGARGRRMQTPGNPLGLRGGKTV